MRNLIVEKFIVDVATHVHPSSDCGFNDRQENIIDDCIQSRRLWNKRPHFRKERNEGGGQMPREAELKSMQFPPFTSRAKRTFLEFSTTFAFFCCKKFFSRFEIYSKSQHTWMGWGRRRNRRLWMVMYLSFCQCVSANVFLRSSHRPPPPQKKNPVHFLHFRKHFHNFKYNNFLFGQMSEIIHVYLAFIYLFSSPERKGLEKENGELTESKWLDFWPLILNGFW